MKTLVADFNKKIEEYKKAQQEPITNIGQKPFVEAFKSLQEDVPEITAACWTQYTPHWMDGETCEFGRNDVWFETSLDEELDFENEREGSVFDKFMTKEELAAAQVEYDRYCAEYKEQLAAYEAHVKANPNSYSNGYSFGFNRGPSRPYDSRKWKKECIDQAVLLSDRYDDKQIKKIRKAIEKFNKVFYSVPDEIYEGIFGDHAKVTLTAEGCEVEEHSHE